MKHRIKNQPDIFDQPTNDGGFPETGARQVDIEELISQREANARGQNMTDIELTPCQDDGNKVEVKSLTARGKEWISAFKADSDGRLRISSKNIQPLAREVRGEGLTIGSKI